MGGLCGLQLDTSTMMDGIMDEMTATCADMIGVYMSMWFMGWDDWDLRMRATCWGRRWPWSMDSIQGL